MWAYGVPSFIFLPVCHGGWHWFRQAACPTSKRADFTDCVVSWKEGRWKIVSRPQDSLRK